MARIDAQAAAAKWAARAAAAQGDYQDGVMSVAQSPGAAAAAKADKWLASVQQSKEKFKAGAARTSLSDWQQATIQKGGPRFATGVQAAQGKMATFTSEFFPFLDGVTNKVKSMPDNTPEQRIARMVEQVRGTAQFRRRGGA